MRYGERLGRRAKWLLGALVVAVAAVPSVWLVVLEQRTQERLVEEVDRGLYHEAALFARDLTAVAEALVYTDHIRYVLNQHGEHVVDEGAPAPYYVVDVGDAAASSVEHPFCIHLADSSVYTGEGAPHPDEVAQVFREASFAEAIAGGGYGAGYVDGPYGPFHFVYRVDSSTAAPVLTGVKVRASHVARDVLPTAFERLFERVGTQRDGEVFPDGLFGFTVVLPDSVVDLNPEAEVLRAEASDAVGVYARALDLGGLFPNWTLEVRYLNELKLNGWLRFAAGVVPLVIVVVGGLLVVRLTMREMELSQAKSLFVSSVSHELKTPLTKINLFNELVKELPVDALEKRRYYHRLIHQECQRLTILVDNVLDLNRIERGEMTYEFASVPIAEIVTEVVETFNVLYEPLGFGIDLQVEEDLPVMCVDPNAIKQVLINLTDNAVKYSPEPHTLVVRAERTQLQKRPAVALTVTDRGVGIPKQKLRLIFEEFYRAAGEEDEEPRVKGSGVGLALVRHIVEAHDGQIRVDSTVGEGSSFTISLPVESKSKKAGC